MKIIRYRRILPAVLACILLSGCTDVRTRLSPDVLAVDLGTPAKIAAHVTQDEEILLTEAESPLLLTDALQITAGAEISTGHLSMVAVQGNPCELLTDALQKQYLAPTCMILSVSRSACGLMRTGSLPTPDQLQSAVDAGQLPFRTADAVVGDLWGGSGITALHAVSGDCLTLMLRDADREYGTLSENACRGLSLLGKRWTSFSFAADGTACEVKRTDLHISAGMRENTLCFTVSGSVSCGSGTPNAAAEALTEMLHAALAETISNGADLLFLRETAIRDRIPDADICTQAQWREMLRDAECEIAIRCK